MSCSRTGISICSRSGRSRTVALNSPALTSSHCGAAAVEGVDVVPDDDHLLRLGRQRDDVVLAHDVRRDRHTLAVDQHVAVAHELTRLAAARRERGAEHDVVEAQLEQAQQVLTGDAGLLVRLGVDELELLLEQAVDTTALLLLAQLEQVLAVADATAAVLAGRVRTPLDRATHRVALRALEEQLHALAPTQPAHRARITRHYMAPSLRHTRLRCIRTVRPSAAWTGGNRCAGSA